MRGIGLATVGLDEDARPAITTDEQMRVTGVERLWAIGDITGRGAFTHMSMYESAIAGDDILGVAQPRTAATHAVSRVTFTDPEVGSVGMTEAQARAAGHRRAHRPRRQLHIDPWLDPRPRQRRLDEARRRRRARHPRRRHAASARAAARC